MKLINNCKEINYILKKTLRIKKQNKMKFGEKSLQKLSTCHKDIQEVLNLAISRTKIDFGISEGSRTVAKQQEYYAVGRTTQMHRGIITNVDGVKKKSKHNHKVSLAVDIYIWHPRKRTRDEISYDGMHLSYIAGLVDACASELYEKNLITSKIRWGGNWDSDGVIIFDQTLDDMPHFEINEA
jgi:peptidoglycan L-alanyl-D-glutamate endopeptidase CwlK